MDRTFMATLVVLGAAAFAGAFVVFSVVPLLTRLRNLAAEAEQLLRQLNRELPALVNQTTQTLKNLDGTLAERLPNLVLRANGTLEACEGSLARELPGLIRETTHTVRSLNRRLEQPGS
jgi:predicted PurR-regulated permease PerM